jgi:hypothetical protein
MAAHGFTVPPIEGADPSADLSALFEAQGVLGQVLTDASAGRPNSLSLERVFAAAGYVFSAIHRALSDEAGEGSFLTRQQRRDVYEGLERARRAVEEVDGNARAKRLQKDAAAGHPLTVCFGRRAPSFSSFGNGCGIVFPDSLSRFSLYCPACRKKPGGRRAREGITRRRRADWNERVPVPRLDAEGRPIATWRLTCSSCLKRFETQEPRVSRCDDCRRNHRGPSLRT